MNKSRGFTLVEVLVATLLMAVAAAFSLSALKVVNNREVDTRAWMQYTLTTKSVKGAFNEYVSAADVTTFVNGQVLGCVNYGASTDPKQKFMTQLCNYEAQLTTVTGGNKGVVILSGSSHRSF